MSGYGSMSGLGGYNMYNPVSGAPMNDKQKKYMIWAIVILIICCCSSSSIAAFMSTSSDDKNKKKK